MKDIVIRPTAKSDIPTTAGLVTECYRFLAQQHGFSGVQLERLLKERCSEACVAMFVRRFSHFVAESGDTILGLVGVEGNDIAELWVAPDCHRKGVGTALFRKAEAIVTNAEYALQTVHTTGYAIPFYEAMGARVVCRKPCDNGPLMGWTMTFMEKELTRKNRGGTVGPQKKGEQSR